MTRKANIPIVPVVLGVVLIAVSIALLINWFSDADELPDIRSSFDCTIGLQGVCIAQADCPSEGVLSETACEDIDGDQGTVTIVCCERQ